MNESEFSYMNKMEPNVQTYKHKAQLSDIRFSPSHLELVLPSVCLISLGVEWILSLQGHILPLLNAIDW